MKSHTSEFKEEIKTLGKQQSVRITYTLNNEQIILTNEDINSATPNYEASLLKSVMKVLELDSNISIPKDTEIKFEYGLLVNDAYEYLNYGNYIVYSSEKQEDTLSYKIKCYDKMLYSMKDYEHIDITYPCTIKQYLVALCNKIGLQFKDSDFANANRQITNELFMTINEDGTYSSMGYTYRDVLDQIAETTGGCICMTLDDKVEVRYINDTTYYKTIEGENINIQDSINLPFEVFKVTGNSVQEGKPIPEVPVEIQNVEGNIDITVCNKNLANLEIISTQYRANTKKINNNTFKVTRIEEGGTFYGQVEMYLQKGKQYTIFLQAEGENSSDATISLCKDYNGVGYIQRNIKNHYTFNTEQEKLVIMMYPTTAPEITFKIMIIEGSDTNQEFIDNQQQTITFPLSEGQKLMKGDYLADDGIHHVRKQMEFDGTEGWLLYPNYETTYRYTFYRTYSDVLVSSTNLADLASNWYIGENSGQTEEGSKDKFTIRRANGGKNIYFFTPKTFIQATTKNEILAEWKSKLSEAKESGNPLVLEYPLAKETVEPYTEEQQKAYNQINSLYSYDEVTNIFSSNEISPIFNIQYAYEMETIDEEYINDVNVNFGEKYRAN